MEKMNKTNVMFLGFSGSGKTTLANKLVDKGFTFISGSMSDLLPLTKEEKHSDMLSHDYQELALQDYQLLNLRNKAFKEADEKGLLSVVSDRSFLDNAAYFLYKQASVLPQCEIEQFISMCRQCLAKHCTHLIFLPFTLETFQEWVIENNNKRILNQYFQWTISQIMFMALERFGYVKQNSFNDMPNISLFKPKQSLEYGAEVGIINNIYGNTKVLILKELELDKRVEIIDLFVNDKI